jgi:hypothetical protein
MLNQLRGAPSAHLRAADISKVVTNEHRWLDIGALN